MPPPRDTMPSSLLWPPYQLYHIVVFSASWTRSLAFKSSRSFAIVSSNCACIAAIRAFPSSISKTPFTHTHTGVYATRAAGLKTHHLREQDLCHPCLGSDLTQQGHAEEQSYTPERQDLKLTSAKLHTLSTVPVCCTNGSRARTISCLDVGACLKVNTRALGRGVLHKKDDLIPFLLTRERHTGRACRQLFT